MDMVEVQRRSWDTPIVAIHHLNDQPETRETTQTWPEIKDKGYKLYQILL